MRHLVESFSEPADHLALDEAMLLLADEGEMPESFRTWELDRPVVVLGRSSKVDYEVNREYCKSNSIPIMRRCSGGASIVAGPGCLFYSLVINLDEKPELRRINEAHAFVMGGVLRAVNEFVSDAELQGICDLTLNGKKFSGNSLRVAKRHLLYHGTVLYDTDLGVLANCLAEAPRQPEYRAEREHGEFVTNVRLDKQTFCEALQAQFDVKTPPITNLPLRRMQELKDQRYDSNSWHFRH